MVTLTVLFLLRSLKKMLNNIRETLFVMHSPCVDNGDTDVTSLYQTETNKPRTSYKKIQLPNSILILDTK